MANIKGLNLEFEDEEEQKRKKKEAIDVDVDSLFNADSESAKKPKPAAPAGGTKPNVQAKTPAQKPKAPSNVQQLRPNAKAPANTGAQAAAAAAPAQRAAPTQSGGGSNEGFEQFQVELFREMKQQIQILQDEVVKLKSESLSKDAISDFKIKTLVEVMTSAKMLDNGLNQIINRIATKAPALKNELLQMKKIIAEFNQGVEKIKNDSSKKSG